MVLRFTALVIALLACSCGKKTDSGAGSGSAAPRTSVTDPIGFCTRARAVLTGRKKCFPEDTSLKMGIDELIDLEMKAPSEPVARRAVAAKCAKQLDGMVQAEPPANCPLDVTDDEAKELATFLTAWKAEQPKPPTKPAP